MIGESSRHISRREGDQEYFEAAGDIPARGGSRDGSFGRFVVGLELGI